jgi:uncharacterized protein (TIRG00374 family)
MSDRSQLPLVQVAASAIVERLLDVATMILALVLVLPLMQVPVLVIRAGTVFGAIILVLLATLFLMVRFRELVERLLQSICRWYKFLPAEAIVARQRELIDGLTPFTKGSVAIRSIGWSIATWALSIGMNWAVIRSFKSDAAPVEAVFMIVALSLAVAVPASPGFIGVFQLVGQQALVLPFGGKYDLTTALAITLTAHLTYYLLTTALGVVGLIRLGESFGHLGQLVRRQASPTAVSPNVIA